MIYFLLKRLWHFTLLFVLHPQASLEKKMSLENAVLALLVDVGDYDL